MFSSIVYMECPLEGTHSPNSEPRDDAAILCDVLVSGWPVNVPDHALYHPLDAFVHSIPAMEQMLSSTSSAYIWNGGFVRQIFELVVLTIAQNQSGS